MFFAVAQLYKANRGDTITVLVRGEREMAYADTEFTYPEQWKRMVHGDSKQEGWGNWQPPRSELNGKTKEQLLNWSSACKAKVTNWIGRIPDAQSKNDGWAECRATWLAKRAEFLRETAETLQSPLRHSTNQMSGLNWEKRRENSGILPMPTERLPFGGRPAFITKRQRSEEEDVSGTGEATDQKESAEEPSPTVTPLDDSLKKPFKPPRKLQKKQEDGPMRWLAEVDLKCPEVLPQEESQIEEKNADSSDSEEE